MKSLCSDTIDILYSNELQDINGPGLLHGDAGMAIVFYLLGACNKDPELLSKGALMLDNIGEHIQNIRTLNFEDGLAGICWAIEWLVQNGFLQGVNTDEVLPEIDNILYKDVTTQKQRIASLLQGAMGKAAYFVKRGKSRNRDTHQFLQLSHQECLVMLTDDIDDIFRNDHGASSLSPDWEQFAADRQIYEHLLDLSTYMLLFGQLFRVNKPLIENTLFDIMSHIERLLTSLFSWNGHITLLQKDRRLYYHLFYMAICYMHSAKVHRHHHWLKEAEYYTESLHAVDIPADKEENDDLYRGLSVYSILCSYQPSLSYKIKLETLINHLKSGNPLFRLYNGWGSIALAELSLSNPELTRNWHELFFIAP
jgi:hypothetical protein